jgi:hypothetical protein
MHQASLDALTPATTALRIGVVFAGFFLQKTATKLKNKLRINCGHPYVDTNKISKLKFKSVGYPRFTDLLVCKEDDNRYASELISMLVVYFKVCRTFPAPQLTNTSAYEPFNSVIFGDK